jgi:hypothetical protein
MQHALFLSDAVRFRGQVEQMVIRAQEQIATHAGGEIEHDVCFVFPDACNHFTKKIRPATGCSGIRVTHVDVHNGGACLGGIDRCPGNLLRRDGQVRVPILGRAGAGYRTGNDDVSVNGLLLSVCLREQ